ncbi:MAG: DUF2282 domain-containing protein [Proteobacteria bacterium]|nr:DUF2282 domain-containing protein [Pseudomonadota bacterium]MDE3207558.1 DUF2282 domain-containing protein [Pseudomonadota bacterium]
MKKEFAIQSAIAGLVALGAIAATSPAFAASAPVEKCFGINAPHMNDCAVANSSHSCAGQATKADEKDAFVLVPHGTCHKIEGGSLTPTL